MKVLIICDEYGHFHAAELTDRPKVIALLKNVDNGSFFADEIAPNYLENGPEHLAKTLETKEWEETISLLCSRAKMEIVEI